MEKELIQAMNNLSESINELVGYLAENTKQVSDLHSAIVDEFHLLSTNIKELSEKLNT